ncbi:lysozyme inhibitor LprI family protein [Chitinilyticum piscinae]|uniref:DUF1311 domain-containing protein n=1 Tax=Chitinilyticum piscinae TaxID=2866724 RepID=A0A8J7K7E4_9NEIS|nr:lysozyme inhibitor LprI family protein [Chitinilyticum piscinae]MBE9607918.1 DUF1311 domain-containing protein [Chitinilyticum piscinae]
MKRFIPVLFCLLAVPAQALDCRQASSTPDIEQCARMTQEKTEQQLNTVYRRVLKQVEAVSANPETEEQGALKKNFIEAQRLWVKFREADCRNVYSYWSGGTIRGTMYLGCMQSRAEQRIKELQQFVENQ